MNNKKIPMRKCIGCGEMFPKKELIRVICTPEKEIEIDLSGRKNGRGCYLCRSKDCFEKAYKSKAINRSFSMEISAEVYEKLKKELI